MKSYYMQKCPACNQNGENFQSISTILNSESKTNCKNCFGNGFLYYIDGCQVSEDKYRNKYNLEREIEFENSNNYCTNCNIDINNNNISPEPNLCDNCYREKEDNEYLLDE